MTEPLDCITCGACCTSEAYGNGPFVTLYGEDATRFTPDELAPDTQGCDFLNTTVHAAGETRCIFLCGTLGETVGCTAYARRPQVCRDFTAGTPECLAARALRFSGAQAGAALRNTASECSSMTAPGSATSQGDSATSSVQGP